MVTSFVKEQTVAPSTSDHKEAHVSCDEMVNYLQSSAYNIFT